MKFNIHWVEICNLEVEAENESEARQIWAEHDYDDEKVEREYDDCEISELKKSEE